MHRAHGTITLVQEERFQLDCDDGSCKLFVLAHDAPLEADELSRLEREGTPVEVEYDDPSDMIVHTAHRLWKEPHGQGH
jgi:hypothetical protein